METGALRKFGGCKWMAPICHSGIGMLTPAMVHFGHASVIREKRQTVLDAAYLAHPDRFVRKPPTPLPLPEEVWINKPPNSDK